MKNKNLLKSLYWIVILNLFICGIVVAQNSENPYEIPNWILLILTSAVAPVIIKFVLNKVPLTFHWIVAYTLSGISGIILMLWKGVPFNTGNLFIWFSGAFMAAQWAYRIIWKQIFKK